MSQASRRYRPDPYAFGAAGVFLVCWALVQRGFWIRHQIIDWPVYKQYGDAIVHHGQLPYRDFAIEYPPGALPAFVLPSFYGSYPRTFAWLMAACGVGVVFAVARLRRRALLFVAVSPLLVGSMIVSRFDLWPALLVCGALVAFVDGRDRIGWGILGVAVAAKLWPLALVPLFLAWSWRRGRTNAELAGIATSVACFLPFAILAPQGLWHSLEGQASRPLQIESLGAAFITTFGSPTEVTTHGSQNLLGYGWVAALLVVATAVSLGWIWWSYARGPATSDELLRHVAAATVAIVAFGKVLSPQFVIWLVPLVPLVRGRRGIAATGVLTAALVLTQAYFPAHYFDYAGSYRYAGVVLARDLVLVALVLVLAWPTPPLRARLRSLLPSR